MRHDRAVPVKGESRTRSARLLAAGIYLCIARAAAGQCAYDVQIIGVPNCPANLSLSPYAINDHGVVVGSGVVCNGNTQRAFRWSPEDGLLFLNLGSDMPTSNALDILEDGTIVGWGATSVFAVRRAFIWKDGVVQKFAGPIPGSWIEATTGFNDGTAVGIWWEPDSEVYFWKNGSFLPMPAELVGGDMNVGQASGNDCLSIRMFGEAFAWASGRLTPIPFPPLYLGPEPKAANRRGEALGLIFWVPGSPFVGYKRGYLWNGSTTQIIEPPPGYNTFQPRDMNDIGQVVGSSYCEYGRTCKGTGVLWQNGTPLELAPFFPAGLIGELDKAWAINNHGQIAAEGWAVGKGSLFILTPNPPPGDVDIDCRVGLSDLQFVLDNWGPITNDSVERADLDEDGAVTGRDLALVLGNWTP
jgi:hypothetical protein